MTTEPTRFGSVDEAIAAAEVLVTARLGEGFVEVASPVGDGYRPEVLLQTLGERSACPLPRLDSLPESELELWARVSPALDLEAWAGRLVFEPDCGPASVFADLVREMTGHVHGCAVVGGVFADTRFLMGWDDDDERTFLVANAPVVGGAHRVYRFNPRSLELDEAAWPSLTAFFWRDREDAEPLASVEPPALDSILLGRRSGWLVCALAGVGTGSLARDARHAAPVSAFEEERALVGSHPHLALYWLLHHRVAGNEALLGETLRATESSENDWVREVRALVQSSTGLVLGALDEAYCEAFRQHAPNHCFARPRRPAAPKKPKAKASPFSVGQRVEITGGLMRGSEGEVMAIAGDAVTVRTARVTAAFSTALLREKKPR